MDRMSAFLINEKSQNNKPKQFDWDKAAKLIIDLGATDAQAGLREDWNWTGGSIYQDGKPDCDYCYLSSQWATPVIRINGEQTECWVYGDNSNAEWPESALKILENK